MPAPDKSSVTAAQEHNQPQPDPGKLAAENIGLAVHIAKQFEQWYRDAHSGGPGGPRLSELIGAAKVGLMKGCRGFDPSKGKFSTYAAPWIKKHLHAATGDHYRHQAYQMGLGKDGEYVDLNSDPEDLPENGGSHTGVNDGDTEGDGKGKTYTIYPAHCFSVHRQVDLNTEEREWRRDWKRRDAQRPAKLAVAADNRFLDLRLAKIALQRLPERERQVIEARFPIGLTPPVSRHELSKRMNVSLRTISRVEEAALAKLLGCPVGLKYLEISTLQHQNGPNGQNEPNSCASASAPTSAE
jgi:RNA polymerase sigma factor (sigma-70 family)